MLTASSTLSFADWAVFTLCLLATFGAVFYGQVLKKREKKSSSILDHLIMGRQLTLPLFVATLVATWYGGIFGVTKIAFEQGIYNFITQGFFWYVTYIIFALYFIKKVRAYEAITLPELLSNMFGPYSAKLSAIFNFFNVIPIAYVISLGMFLQAVFGWSLTTGMFIGLSTVMVYSLFGGFRAVVFSDLVQFFVMCLGVFLVLVFSVNQYGGIDFLKQSLPATHFDPMGGENWGTLLVWGLIALSTLVDPNFYQRCFAAKNDKTAKKGILLSTCVWVCFDICTTAGAMYARAVLPEAESGTAYLSYALQILPEGLRGFFLAGILATILSTLDSYLFLAGTTVSYDLAPKKYKQSLWANHFGVIGVAILAFVLAGVFEGNIKAVWKTLGSYSAACLLFPVVAGHLFPGKISDKQFVSASVMGIIATTYWRHAKLVGFWAQVDEIYIGVATTFVSLVLYHLFSRTLRLGKS